VGEVENQAECLKILEKKFKGSRRHLAKFSGRGGMEKSFQVPEPRPQTGGQGDRGGSSKEEHDLPKGEEMLPAGPARAK